MDHFVLPIIIFLGDAGVPGAPGIPGGGTFACNVTLNNKGFCKGKCNLIFNFSEKFVCEYQCHTTLPRNTILKANHPD